MQLGHCDFHRLNNYFIGEYLLSILVNIDIKCRNYVLKTAVCVFTGISDDKTLFIYILLCKYIALSFIINSGPN